MQSVYGNIRDSIRQYFTLCSCKYFAVISTFTVKVLYNLTPGEICSHTVRYFRIYTTYCLIKARSNSYHMELRVQYGKYLEVLIPLLSISTAIEKQ